MTFEELIITVLHNEKTINEKTVKKVFNEILKMTLTDAEYLLNDNMDRIIKIINDNKF